MMKQGLQWSPCHHHSLFIASRPSLPFPIRITRRFNTISATTESTETQELTARERRQLRNKNRESKSSNWKEEVNDKLIQKKTKPIHWKERLNFDGLADLGPQWWTLQVPSSQAEKSIEDLVRALVRKYPDLEFEVFSPTINVKKILKNGTISVKPKSIYPGYIFLRCMLNKELHDFIRARSGIYGFVGFEVSDKVPKTVPKTLTINEIEAVFKQVKVEQEETDKAFEEEQQKDEMIKSDMVIGVTHPDADNVTVSNVDSKPKRKSRKKSSPLGNNKKLPARGSTVQIVSGSFTDFSGSVKMLNRKTGKVTVGVTVFGKESLVELDISEIVAETN